MFSAKVKTDIKQSTFVHENINTHPQKIVSTKKKHWFSFVEAIKK